MAELKPFDINELKSVEVSLASPATIRGWSCGEVTKPETINYRTQNQNQKVFSVKKSLVHQKTILAVVENTQRNNTLVLSVKNVESKLQ